ncbi:MAG: hypothetical protein H0V82_12210 [Candidatus Protochlamydia sp.]|nr:hypothetical protein [Candidatus Protochlamydia sp.]
MGYNLIENGINSRPILCNNLKEGTSVVPNLQDPEKRMNTIFQKLLTIEHSETIKTKIKMAEMMHKEQSQIAEIHALLSEQDQCQEDKLHLTELKIESTCHSLEQDQNKMLEKANEINSSFASYKQNLSDYKHKAQEIEENINQILERKEAIEHVCTEIDEMQKSNTNNLIDLTQIYIAHDQKNENILARINGINLENIEENLLIDEGIAEKINESQEEFAQTLENLEEQIQTHLEIQENWQSLEENIEVVQQLAQESRMLAEQAVINHEEMANVLNRQIEHVQLDIHNLHAARKTENNLYAKTLEYLENKITPLAKNAREICVVASDKIKINANKIYQKAVSAGGKTYEWMEKRFFQVILKSPLTYLFGAVLLYQALKIVNEKPLICLTCATFVGLFYVIRNPAFFSNQI